MKKISGGEAAAAAAQARVSRYKEERRKQLANQFANLVALPRNYDYDGTSSAALTSSDASRKTAAFKSHNLIVVQDDETRRPKLSNHYRQTNVETRRKYDASEDAATAIAHRTRNIRKQQKSNGISPAAAAAAESNNVCGGTATTATTPTTKTAAAASRCDNGERAAKRKSHSNGRSANYDKTTGGVNYRNYHSNHNGSNNQHHAHSHSADESTLAKKWNSRVTVHSSLPLPVTASAGTTTSSSSSSFNSSHKTKNASPNGSRRKLSLVDSQSAAATVGSCNGVDAAASENTDSPAMEEENFFDAKEAPGSRIPRPISAGTMCIPQDESGSSVEAPCARTDVTTGGVEFAPDDDRFRHRDEPIEYKNRLPQTTPSGDGCASNGHRAEAELPERTYGTEESPALIPSPNVSLDIIEENATTTPKQSILKKKYDKRSNSLDASKPNSILKRKNFEDCCAGKTVTTTTTTSVSSRQGILKKYYSFDEEEVRRRGSSSETDAGKLQEFKPILKPGRRSSLEELTQNQCPELHSILKRSKAQHDENCDARSSILKRKAFGTNAYNSFNDRSSVEETTAESGAAKPILKNKRPPTPECAAAAAAERPHWETTPRPILKKKASSENDTDEEKPMRPILKSSRKSLDEEMANISIRETSEAAAEASTSEGRSIKPILKKNYAESRGVKSDDDSVAAVACPHRVKRHSLPGIGTFAQLSPSAAAENGGESCGKNSRFELFLKSECRDTRIAAAKSVEIDFEGEESLRDEILSTESTMEEKRGVKKVSKTNAKNDEASKVTRDGDTTAATAVGDEKSNDRDVMSKLKRSNSVSTKASLFSQLEKDSKKAAAETTKVKKKADVVAAKRKLKVKCSDLASRFSTQPITWDEVAEAKKQNEVGRNKLADIKNEIIKNSLTARSGSVERACDGDGAGAVSHGYLSISERVKLFTEKAARAKIGGGEATAARTTVGRTHNNRFKTQPITFEEVEMAKILAVDANKTAVESGKIPVIGVKVMEKPKTSSSSETKLQSETRTSSSSGNREKKTTQPEKKIGASKHGGDPIMNFGSIVADEKDVVDDRKAVTRINGNSSIAQRRAALEKSGQVDWKKRISRFDPENEVPQFINVNETQETLRKELLSNGCRIKKPEPANERSNNDATLADRLEKLENARETWKNRVEPSDAVQFSVAGKMVSLTPVSTKTSSSSSPPSERKKRTPCPSRFRSFREHRKDVHSDPTSPLKSKSTAAVVCRSNSLPSEHTDDDDEKGETAKHDSVVNVPQIFDEQFAAFFGTAETKKNAAEAAVDFNTDLGDIKIDTSKMLRPGRRIKAQRKHGTSGNPLKTMAARIDIKNEYTEVKTAANVAERETKRANVEKFAKNSTLAVEALAGLASKEDFQSVQLKKAAPLSSPMLPYKPLMLLHVKGRRHVQTRLVEPVVESINSGDSYVLVTPNEVYHWIGKYSNVIEKSRGVEIAQHVVATHDLGCVNATNVVTVQEDAAKTNCRTAVKFWTLLGATPEQAKTVKAVEGGHPDEDEEYENALLSTNMIYEVNENELVPVEKYWATIPKIQMLDPNKVFVLDFGSELYVWMGKNVDLKLRKWSTQLAKELWENGFNYDECDLCPITSSLTIGMRNGDAGDKAAKRGTERPEWCLFAKVTQHMETVLFREKFVDWPDFTRVIRAKGKDEDTERQADSSFDMSACDVAAMLDEKCAEPDLVLEGSHLGRGDKFFEEELRRYFVVKTSDVRMWHIAEFESELVADESLGQFYSTDSYVVRWLYSVSSTGRELSGLPSKHTTTGRDRCVYFCWQGKNASLNEQGAAALLTVELDKEKGQQLRICQGYEPPAFFRLFAGKTVVYRSKTSANSKGWRLFVCRGEIEEEAALLEVTCNVKQLRSRACFVLVNARDATAYVWNGCKADKRSAKVCEVAANRLKEKPPPELGVRGASTLKVTVVDEGREPKEFFAGLGGSSKKMYWSLVDDKNDYNCTPLLFSLSSNSGAFCAAAVWSSCRHKDIVTAYPFLQADLYAAHQPALFLLDTGKELWLWQGWWPERAKTSDSEEDSDNRRGSAAVRWQAERRAAMQTALNYWKRKYADRPTEAYLVWAGLEPVQFTNLFPDWEDRDDVTEINISDGRKPGELLDIKQELERLTQSTYPIEQLLQRPLPDGVDPTKLELYLSASHFEEILKVSKEEFVALPSWKQTNLKKNAGLF